MKIMVKTALIRINTQEKTEKIIPHRRANRPGRESADESFADTPSICSKAALTLTWPSSLVST